METMENAETTLDKNVIDSDGVNYLTVLPDIKRRIRSPKHRNRKPHKQCDTPFNILSNNIENWKEGVEKEIKKSMLKRLKKIQSKIPCEEFENSNPETLEEFLQSFCRAKKFCTMRDARKLEHAIKFLQNHPSISKFLWMTVESEKLMKRTGATDLIPNVRKCWAKKCKIPEECNCNHGRMQMWGDSYSKSREHIASRNRRPNWKAKMSKNYYSFRESVGSAYSNVRFWANSIHNIEGHYGTAVAAVFFFMQWLMSINLWIMIAVISFIVIPNSVIINNSSVNKTSITNRPVASLTCNSNETDEQEDAEFGDFQDLLQGTGWMEWTPMFYGYYFYNYTNNTYYEDGNAITYGCTKDLTYNLPLAYIIVTVVYFSMCLILILRSTAKDSREILFTATAKINEGCNLVFGGWDFCIVEEKEAIVRREIIYNEITNIFEEEKLSEERLHRTKRQNVKIIFIRILINTFVFIILACCGLLIYAVIIGSQQALSVYSGSGMIVLLIEFLPPFTITTLNLIVPIIFEKLVIYECYSPVSVINMTLGRTVVLKLAGILVLLASLYKSIVKNKFCTHHCWETYVGQQIYKLTIMDFVSIIFITFFIQFPRKLIVERVQWPFIQWIGQQPFDIPSQVLDIVYSQTLCWLGTFFSPLLSVVNVIKFFILFYVKRFSLFVNCAPARLTYRASKSNKLFMMILLLSYLIAILPVFFSIVEITPSNDCGPFIGYNTMWDIIPETMENWPASLRKLINYFTTAGFIVPAIASLSLIIYFYATIASAHSHEKELMQDQLLVEGQDKQYLLKKLHQVMEELSNTASIGAVHSFQARQRID